MWRNDHNSVTLIVGSTAGVLLADRMMWLQYAADADNAVDETRMETVRGSLRRMSRTIILPDNMAAAGAEVLPQEAEVATEGTDDSQEANETTVEVVDNEEKQGYLARTLATLGNVLVITLIAIGYPVAVLPYYRAESTTECVILACIESTRSSRRTNSHAAYPLGPDMYMATHDTVGSALQLFAWRTPFCKSSFSPFRDNFPATLISRSLRTTQTASTMR